MSDSARQNPAVQPRSFFGRSPDHALTLALRQRLRRLRFRKNSLFAGQPPRNFKGFLVGHGFYAVHHAEIQVTGNDASSDSLDPVRTHTIESPIRSFTEWAGFRPSILARTLHGVALSEYATMSIEKFLLTRRLAGSRC